MQPSEPLSVEIKTIADWIYEQFKATEPVEVKNILDRPYSFKYCVGEEIETPDQVTRRVASREYETKTFQPGETQVLMGAAAYIFVDGVARQFLYEKVIADSTEAGMDLNKAETAAANATADVQQLVEAAKLAIVGKVGYANQAAPVAATAPVLPNNPNAINHNGTQPQQTTTEPTPAGNLAPGVATNETPEDDAFAGIATDDRFSVVPAKDSDDGKAHFFVDGQEVTNAEYNEAQSAAAANA